MTDTLFALVSSYGIWIVGVSAYLSCLLVPIPTSLVMLAGGAFAAAGDLAAWQVFAAAFAGAVLGDQTGFNIGRGGGRILHYLTRKSEARLALYTRAHAMVERGGGMAVFFSTWLFAPLGPYVNFVAGAAGLGWLRFTFWDAMGEFIWTAGYLTLGYTFADQIAAVAEVASNVTGLLVGGLLTFGLGLVLRDSLRRARRAPTTD